jgi:hypothetical protein
MKRNRLLKTTKISKYRIFAAGLWGLFPIAFALLFAGCAKSVKPPDAKVVSVSLPVLARLHPSMRQINDIDRQLIELNNQIRRAGGITMPNLPEIKVVIIPLPALNMPLDVRVSSKDIDKVTEIEIAAAREQLIRTYNRRMKSFSESAVDEMDAKVENERKRIMLEQYNREIEIAKTNRIPVRSTQLNKDNAERIRVMPDKADIVNMTKAEKEKAWSKYQDELADAKKLTAKLIAEISAKYLAEMEAKVRAFKLQSDKELAAELEELRKRKIAEMKDNRLISAPDSPRSAPTPPEVRMDDSGDAKNAAANQSKNDNNRNNKVIAQSQANMINLLKKRKKIEELIKKDTEQAVKTLGEMHGFNIRYNGTDGKEDITIEAAGWLTKNWGK